MGMKGFPFPEGNPIIRKFLDFSKLKIQPADIELDVPNRALVATTHEVSSLSGRWALA
jgi:hypothetical protein